MARCSPGEKQTSIWHTAAANAVPKIPAEAEPEKLKSDSSSISEEIGQKFTSPLEDPK